MKMSKLRVEALLAGVLAICSALYVSCAKCEQRDSMPDLVAFLDSIDMDQGRMWEGRIRYKDGAPYARGKIRLLASGRRGLGQNSALQEYSESVTASCGSFRVYRPAIPAIIDWVYSDVYGPPREDLGDIQEVQSIWVVTEGGWTMVAARGNTWMSGVVGGDAELIATKWPVPVLDVEVPRDLLVLRQGPMVLEIPESGFSSVRVVDDLGAPISGASVSLLVDGGGGPVPWVGPFSTGEDGSVLIEEGVGWDSFHVQVDADGYVPVREFIRVHESEREAASNPWRVVLERSRTIQCAIRTKSGEVVPGAWALLMRHGSVGRGGVAEECWYLEVDQDGQFTCDVGVEWDAYFLVGAPGYREEKIDIERGQESIGIVLKESPLR